jgi:NADH dehydrogenase FAD-containing subunit
MIKRTKYVYLTLVVLILPVQLYPCYIDQKGVFDIALVSRDNFFFFTPMLPQISSGMIETRHIVTPLRVFCNRAKFYEADVRIHRLMKIHGFTAWWFWRSYYLLNFPTFEKKLGFWLIGL